MQNFQNYLIYLNFLNEKLTEFFNAQRPYIKCTKGCSKCCKSAQFPYSEIELKLLLMGYDKLDEVTKSKVKSNIEKVKQQKSEYTGDKFRYDCPFLIDDVCCVYDYRGIICRTFGLMAVDEDGKFKAPFCAFEGLSYSNVIDEATKTVSVEKFKKLNTNLEPLGYNVRYEFLTDSDTELAFKFNFGEKRSLINWF